MGFRFNSVITGLCNGISASSNYLMGNGTPTTEIPEAIKEQYKEIHKQDPLAPLPLGKPVLTPYQSVLTSLGHTARFTNPITGVTYNNLKVTGLKTLGYMGAGAALSYSELLYSPYRVIGLLPEGMRDNALYYPIFSAITGFGLYQFAKHLGTVIYPADENSPTTLSKKSIAGWAGVFAGLWGTVRFLSDTTGVHQFMPNGSNFLFGGWLDRMTSGALTLNTDLYAAYWSTFITAAFVTNVFFALANNLPQIAYSAMGIFEKEATGKSRVFQYLEDQPYHQKFKNRGIASHERVIPEVQQYQPAESQALEQGIYSDDWMSKYIWRFIFIVGSAALGYAGSNHIDQLVSGEATDPVWNILAGVGGSTLSIGLLLSEFKLAREKIPGMASVASMKSAIASLLNSKRLPYYAVYTAIGGVLTGGSNVFSGMLQGLDNTNHYYLKTFLRGFYSPYLNRIVLAVRLARGERNISTFSALFPGFLLVMGLVEAQAQAPQAVVHLYDSAAIEYQVATSDEDKDEALERMHYYEALIKNCIQNDCFGHEDTLKLAQETWIKIETKKHELGLLTD